MSVHFDDAQPGQCRYPLWNGRARTGLVCGDPAKPGSSYCRRHHALVYDPPTPRRVNAVEVAALRTMAGRKLDCSVHPEFEETK